MKNLLTYLILLIAAAGCGEESFESTEIKPQKDILSEYYGNWQSLKKNFIYGSVLQINKDKTFSFSYGACTMAGFSFGTWEIHKGEIVLNSNNIDECHYIAEFGIYGLKVLDDSIVFPEEKTTIEGCKPEEWHDEYVVFVNERFNLLNDTLIHSNPKDTIDMESHDKFLRKPK